VKATVGESGTFTQPRNPARSSRPAHAVTRAVESIRELIVKGELLPGEQIRQSQMADGLQLSRVPVREALKVLQVEGVVHHTPNRGFFVAKFSSHELAQIYFMRDLLESELLRTALLVDELELAEMHALNDELERASRVGDVVLMASLNRRFHFSMFELSPLRVVHLEVERLWRMSDAYRILYLYDSAARNRVIEEHRLMLAALKEHDLEELVLLGKQHRGAAMSQVSGMLAR
jgi:DNA-binding GntR family transcriptional regulator